MFNIKTSIMKKLFFILVSVFASVSAFSAVIPDSINLDKQVVLEAKGCKHAIVMPNRLRSEVDGDIRKVCCDDKGYYIEMGKKYYFISLDGKVSEISEKQFRNVYLSTSTEITAVLENSFIAAMSGNFKYAYTNNDYVVVLLK